MSINGVNQNLDIQKLMQAMKNGQVGKAGLSKKVPVHMTMNGSVFNMPGVKSPSASNVQGNLQAQTTQNVVAANTAKSVSNVSATSSTSSTQKTQATQDAQGQENTKDIDLSQYDFDNLTSVGDGDLKLLKRELTELKDSDIPRFMENSIKSKLDKVNGEIQKRAEGSSGHNQDASMADGEAAVGDAEGSATDSKAATAESERGTEEMNKSQDEMQSLNKKMKSDEKKFKKTMQKEEKALKLAQKQNKKPK